MKPLIWSILILVILFSREAQPQVTDSLKTGSPDWIIHQIFGPSRGSVDLAPYIGGELVMPDANQPDLANHPFVDSSDAVSIRALERNPDKIIYAVFVRNKDAQADIYCYMKRNTKAWQLVAIRSLATYGVTEAFVSELEKKPTLSGKERWELAKARLTVSSDSALKAYFWAHQATYSRILKMLSYRRASDSLPLTDKRRLERGYLERLDTLSREIGKVEDSLLTRGGPSLYLSDCPGTSVFMVGGLLDNAVGYAYLPDSCTVPSMWQSAESHGSGVIYIERIAPQWYLFKTT